MVEIHDASAPGGDAALFGFIGVPAEARARVSDETLRSQCRAQLVRLFGARAAAPVAADVNPPLVAGEVADLDLGVDLR